MLKRAIDFFRSVSRADGHNYKQETRVVSSTAEAIQRALDAGDLEAAEAHYEEALGSGEAAAAILMAGAGVAKSRGDESEAVARLTRAMELAPLQAELQLDIGLRLEELGALDLALAALACAARREEPFPRALSRLGLLQLRTGLLDDALVNLARVVQLLPGRAEARNDLGVAYGALGELPAAMAEFQHALRLEPDSFEVLMNAGRAASGMWDHASARQYLEKAVALRPDSSRAKVALGMSLLADRDIEGATHLFREINEDDTFDSHFYSGMARMALERFEGGWSSLKRARELAPNRYEVYGLLGFFAYNHGRIREAEELYDKALELNPADPVIALSRGFIRLLQGDFERGWEEAEIRFKTAGYAGLMQRFPADALWDGSDPAGKTLLIWAEQGLGDQIQFVRYAPEIATRGAEVIVECAKPLVPLFADMKGISHVLPAGEMPPPFDLHCPVVSLPRAMGTRLDSVPAPIPYLRAEPDRADHWSGRLSPLAGIRVGLVWAGNPLNGSPIFDRFDRRRSIALREFSPLWEVPNVTFVSLQKGSPAEQIKGMPSECPIVDLMDEVDDFSDTAALVANLDLVISVDTSVVHLAGAMGKPVWILTRIGGCWRWLLDRQDSPWYPTARLFRQTTYMDWTPVIAELKMALAQFAPDRFVRPVAAADA